MVETVGILSFNSVVKKPLVGIDLWTCRMQEIAKVSLYHTQTTRYENWNLICNTYRVQNAMKMTTQRSHYALLTRPVYSYCNFIAYIHWNTRLLVTQYIYIYAFILPPKRWWLGEDVSRYILFGNKLLTNFLPWPPYLRYFFTLKFIVC